MAEEETSGQIFRAADAGTPKDGQTTSAENHGSPRYTWAYLGLSHRIHRQSCNID